MRIVAARELQDWLAHGTVLEKDSRGPKVVLLPDGLIFKVFHNRRRRWLARISPAAKRFARNAGTLDSLGIPAPTIVETLWLDREKGLSACTYRPLPGTSLEALLRENPAEIENLIPALATFILRLHRNGIYFRSLHLGNLLSLPEGGFGLIDFLDLVKKRRRLNGWEAKRNFNHLRRYLERRKITNFPIDRLTEMYSTAARNLQPPSSDR
ncbi:lipopolysaccharide kinase InaA family protein [Pseudomonas saudiphocaensis]|uniref:lipopolysaccharide kinase InaA family protein n=1 Tax=Pseudomonas saudiphocaensis TaxID=1499686 RepID=UPI000F780C2E|nr:lipopolysaccharide kinase InaA family protein [Pseudomonas saudiphocaensis]RRV17535.1 toluene tolerance protein [Pseudomonas saudiphocaensis]